MLLERLLASSGLDTAVEIETPSTSGILGLIEPIEDSAVWDSLNAAQRLERLREAARSKTTSFAEDRKVPGFRVKERVTLKFSKETIFLGKSYPPGEHEIELGKYLQKIEFVNPQQNPEWLELHLRGPFASDQMALDAWKLLELVGAPRKHLHVHVVARLPYEKLRQDPFFEAFRIAEYFRRVNIVAEMQSIVESGAVVRTRATTEGTYAGPLSTKNLAGVFAYLRDVGRGVLREIGDDFKIGWVGFRGSDKYDQPGLFGFEIRSILGDTPEASLVRLKSIQQAMNAGDFKIPEARLRALYSGDESAEAALLGLHYNREWSSLWADLPADLAAVARPDRRFYFEQVLSQDDLETKMLFHDWSREPALAGQAELLQKIRRQQIQTIQNLSRPNSDIPSSMKEFLVQSGLYEALARTL